MPALLQAKTTLISPDNLVIIGRDNTLNILHYVITITKKHILLTIKLEDIIMCMIKRKKVEFNFTNVEARIKNVDANTTDIYFISAVNARQLFNILKDNEGFDTCNDVCVKDTHTISIIGEVDVRYNKDTKLLTIVSFS